MLKIVISKNKFVLLSLKFFLYSLFFLLKFSFTFYRKSLKNTCIGYVCLNEMTDEFKVFKEFSLNPDHPLSYVSRLKKLVENMPLRIVLIGLWFTENGKLKQNKKCFKYPVSHTRGNVPAQPTGWLQLEVFYHELHENLREMPRIEWLLQRL